MYMYLPNIIFPKIFDGNENIFVVVCFAGRYYLIVTVAKFYYMLCVFVRVRIPQVFVEGAAEAWVCCF